MRAWPLLLLLACDRPPTACHRMCAEAAAGLEPCLEEDGLGWEAMGYQDADDFQDACETWAWEQEAMARDASPEQGGGEGGVRQLARTCKDWRTTFTEGTCEERQSVPWGEPAWK